MGGSKAWEELGNGTPSRAQTSNVIPIRKSTDNTNKVIGDMLDVAITQSENPDNKVYLFLSRIEGIVGHIIQNTTTPINKLDLIKTVSKEFEIPQHLIATHIEWEKLILQNPRLPEFFTERTISHIKNSKQDSGVLEVLKDIWKNHDKNRWLGVIKTFQDYNRFFQYFFIRYFGCSIEDYIRDNGKQSLAK